MYIIILNINNIFNIIFKYKYNLFIKLYLNNYIKINKLLTYIVRYYFTYNKYINKHIKNKSLVNISNKKIRIQKGLGKARLKNFSSPICKQGGCAFGPLYIDNIYKYNSIKYKLIYIYLLLNKRSNIIILKYEYLLINCYIFYNNIYNLIDIINILLYFKGIRKYNNYIKYIIFNFNDNIINKNIIINFIIYDYLIFII